MGIMKQTLTTLLTEHCRSQTEVLKAQQEQEDHDAQRHGCSLMGG
jgi:hypothetical protein